jgi:hypothetical protein
MAHETAHVIQQGHAPVVQRKHVTRSGAYEYEAHQAAESVIRDEPFAVQQRTNQPRVQRLGLSDILDGLAELAANLPGFTLLTVIIGRNPINLRRVERNFTNLLRGFMGLIPGGEILFQVLNRYGIVERLGNWVSEQVSALGITYEYLRGRFTAFTGSLGLGDLFNPSGVWQRATGIFSEPINRIRSFVSRLITQAITWLKETFMQPLSDFCREIPGYRLVTVLLGRDPFTNAPVERSALNVVRAFAEFIPGGTEKVNQLVESRALQRAYEWFVQETQARNLTWERISGTFASAWNSLRLEDVLNPIDTLRRMVTMFRPLMVDLVSFAGAALMKLLELIFEAVMGAGGARVLAILKRARETFLTIIRDPVGFLGNLLRAVGQGVRQFMTNILAHLRQGVIAWLTGPVAAAGVQMPEQWDIRGIIWFVMQILGLTWPRVRQKLVRLMGERVVGMLESGFQLIQDIRERGLVQALRDRVTEFFGQLREAALGSIRSFIQQRLVMAGIQQLLSLLSPVGAVIQAIIKTYTTIRFFIDKINQILDLVESIVNSIAAIASGSIGAAANFIERTMARTIPVILDFLARFIGLGDVGGQVQRTIRELQSRVDQMLDRAVDWIRNMAQRVVTAVRSRVAPTPAAAASGDLRDRAGAMVLQRLHGGHTDAEILAVVAQVREELRPLGLSRLEFAPASPSGESMLVAQASAPKNVAKKKKPSVTTASVVMRVRLVFNRPALPAIEAGAGRALRFFQYDIPRARSGDVTNPVTGLREAAMIGTPPPDQYRSGTALLRPSATDTEVQIVSWNSGFPGVDNASHAEKFFVEWLAHAGAAVRQGLTQIHVDINLSPCTFCARRTLPDFSGSGVTANLTYRIPFQGRDEAKVLYPNATTVEDMDYLRGKGWSVTGPAPAWTDETKEADRRATKSIMERNP